MKKHTWDNPNKMHFESKHKSFNRAVDCISTGNVMGKTQMSGCIRAHNETECNGVTNPPGHLQDYDLNWLNQYLSQRMRDFVRSEGKTKKLIGYAFFYWKGKQRIFIGWAVTDGNHNLLKHQHARYNAKTISALNECLLYIAN